MTEADDAQIQRLETLFRRRPVAQLGELRRELEVSGRTVFRALARRGYVTSYSHAGRYYTLRGIPTFDANGLWFHGEVRFSAHGTLRATIVVLVHQAPAGHTHDELAMILGLRVHDTLRSLVRARRLARERIESVYVYLDVEPARAAAQLEHRRRAGAPPGGSRPPPSLDLPRVVEVLVAVIQAPADDARTIATRLRARGIDVGDDQVEAVFTQYGLKKKRRPPARNARGGETQRRRARPAVPRAA